MEHDQREKEDIQHIGKIVLLLVAFSLVLLNRTLNLEKTCVRIMMNFESIPEYYVQHFPEID
jgi:hypothetical protein